MKKIFQIILVGLGIVCSQVAFAQSNQVIPVPAPIQVEMQNKADNNLVLAPVSNKNEQKPAPKTAEQKQAEAQHIADEAILQERISWMKYQQAQYKNDPSTQQKIQIAIDELQQKMQREEVELKQEVNATETLENVEQKVAEKPETPEILQKVTEKSLNDLDKGKEKVYESEPVSDKNAEKPANAQEATIIQPAIQNPKK